MKISVNGKEWKIRTDSGEQNLVFELKSIEEIKPIWETLSPGVFNFTLIFEDDEEKEIDRVDVYDSYVLNMELITGDPIVLQVFLQQKSDLEKAQEEIDAMAEKVIETVTTWKVGASYKKNDLVKKDSVLYMVLQDHTSQEDWPPETTYALYRKIRGDSPTPTVPEWVQPTGAHDAYNKGDLVMHKDKKWESMIDANVWEPGVYGWEAR